MQSKGWIGILLAVLPITGCVQALKNPSEETKAKIAEVEQTSPVCVGQVDCKAKWKAAQEWVAKNARKEIKVVTDQVIETEIPYEHEPKLAARVTKESLGNGKYKLVIKMWCGNIFRCVPHEWDASLDFNRTISAVKP